MVAGWGLCIQGEAAGCRGGIRARDEFSIVAHAILVVVRIGVVCVGWIQGKAGFPVIEHAIVVGIEVGAGCAATGGGDGAEPIGGVVGVEVGRGFLQ